MALFRLQICPLCGARRGAFRQTVTQSSPARSCPGPGVPSHPVVGRSAPRLRVPLTSLDGSKLSPNYAPRKSAINDGTTLKSQQTEDRQKSIEGLSSLVRIVGG